jgi:putative transcriptional regulator
MGLVINRRTEIPISKVFDDIKGAKGRADPIYLGGPVERSSVRALLRSRSKLTDSLHIFGDVYLISSKTLLERSLADNNSANAMHVYLGYAGWGPGQLEAEVELGAWWIVRGDADAVFDPDPESVWDRLFRRRDLQIALAPVNASRL